MAFDFAPYATGGATRPDSFSSMSPDFALALGQLLSAAPKGYVQVSSGYRSPDRQAQLWADAIKKYGNADAARKWVAPPGRSKHNHGGAADLKFLNDTARQWVNQNAGKFGLSFPMAHENWHVELAGGRDHQHAPSEPAQVFTGPGGPAMGFTGDAPAPTLADLVSPAPAQGFDLGNVVSQYMQGRQQRIDQEAVDKARKQALFGGGLADLYA